jgi:NADPH2:quinone reductase
MEKEYVMQSKQPKKEKTQTMRAITVDIFDSSPGLRQDLPAPTPADNEVLVRVRASSVSPVDNSVAAGMLKDMVEHEFPVTLGRDFAGVVEQAGSEVSGLSEGDEVFGFITGMSPAVHEGTWAELIAVPESSATRKPEGVDTASAGAAPLAAITAMSALDALGVSEGDTVLVVGANGGVGSFAVQLAANAGARVIAPGLPEDEEYLKDLGVSEVLPRDADIAALVHERYPEGIEALLDLVSYAPEGFDTHAEVLKDDGRGASSLSAAGEGSERHNVMAMPTPEHLQRLARVLEAGTLRVPIQRSYELDQAADALQALSAEHTQGKLAIRVA